MSSSTRKAVFLDRDGTLNHDAGYPSTVDEFTVFPESGPALVRLNRAGLPVMVVTNQSGIARGILSMDELHRMHEKLRVEIRRHGAWLDDIFVCPHHPDDGCACRKPRTGMFERASRQYDLDLAGSYMVGDKIIDIQVANRIGAKGILVLSGPRSREAVEASQAGEARVNMVVDGITEAVDWILQDLKRSSLFSVPT